MEIMTSRRDVLTAMALGGAALPAAWNSAQALEANASRAGVWLLGDNLSLAALLYAQGAPQDTTNQILAKAKSIAEIVGVEIKPFPARSPKQAEADADIIHYLIKGDGALLGAALAKKYGEEHGLLFEVSVKSNLLIRLYAPGDSLGQSIAQVVKQRCEQIRLPSHLWGGLVAAIAGKRPSQEIKDAVFKMHKDVAAYLLPS